MALNEFYSDYTICIPAICTHSVSSGPPISMSFKSCNVRLCRIDGVDSAALKPNYLITLDDFKLCFFFRLHVILMLSVPPCVCASVFCTSPPSYTINMSVVHLCFSKSFYQLKLTEGF